MRGQKRTLAQVADGVALALVQGIPAASKATGIPMRSLRRYKDDPELAALGLSAREEVAERMWVVIQEGLEQVEAGLLADEPLKDKAAALAMLIEKRALLVGEATSRTESRDLTNTFDDHELDALKRAIAAIPDPEGEEGAAVADLGERQPA